MAIPVAAQYAVEEPPAIHAPAPAPAPPRGEIQVAYGFGGGFSDWTGDVAGYSGFTLGLRLFRLFTPYVGAALGYGRVDERLLTRLTVGIEFGVTIHNRFRPRAYAGFVHQHEESLAAVAQQPFGSVLGIGTGIRHRAGVQMGVGLDITVLRRRMFDFSVGPDLSANWLTYSSGPDWYYIIGVSAALHVRLF